MFKTICSRFRYYDDIRETLLAWMQEVHGEEHGRYYYDRFMNFAKVLSYNGGDSIRAIAAECRKKGFPIVRASIVTLTRVVDEFITISETATDGEHTPIFNDVILACQSVVDRKQSIAEEFGVAMTNSQPAPPCS